METFATITATKAIENALPRHAFAFAAALALLCCGACDYFKPSATDASDSDAPEIQRAATFEQRGEIDKAIAEYKSALLTNPGNALAHMNLGLLLEDYSHDYVGAIYHFRTYLELRPKTQKKTMIEDRLRQSTQLLGAELSRDIITSGDNAIIIQKFQDEQKKTSSLESEKSALSAELEQTKAELARVCATTNNLHRRIEMLSAVPLPTESQSNPGHIPAVETDDSGVRTYTVKKGDSLSHIAESVYGDSAQWPRIKNANHLTSERVKEGMILTIP